MNFVLLNFLTLQTTSSKKIASQVEFQVLLGNT